MNKQKLKTAFSILKSQKLISYFDIEIYYNGDVKEKSEKMYRAYFQTYKGKYEIVNFSYIKNQKKWISDIKEMIYNNYILSYND